MKIAVLSSFPPKKCGIAYLTRNLFDELRSLGHELITFGIDDSDCDFPIRSNSFTGLRDVARIIKRENIDYVSVQFIIGFYGKRFLGLNFLLFLWSLRKKRVIVTIHELHHIRSLRHFLKNPAYLFHLVLEILISHLSSGVILHTETQAGNLRKYGVRNVRCIYLGLLPKPIPRLRTSFKEALFFGKLNPAKGVHLFTEIAKACPEINFTVACSSDPQHENYRQQLVKNFAQVGNVQFICKDWIGEEEKEAYFENADVLILPYIDLHYQSGVASESGVYNIPVILPGTGPLCEIVLKYHTGETLDSLSPAEIKTAIHTVFANYPRYLSGIQKYRDDANWTMAAKNYLEFLEG